MMASYSLDLLGTQISFATDAGQDRVREATTLLETRFEKLNERGRTINKEKILLLLALSLADDYLEVTERLTRLELRMDELSHAMEGHLAKMTV